MNYKQALIASTAICAASGLAVATAQAAEKPKLKISGYQEIFLGFADGDREGNAPDGTPTYTGGSTEEGVWNLVHYGEIRFEASGMTDSGMKWKVRFEDVQNEADDEGKKVSTDEAHMELSGSWGKLEIGGQDGAHDKMHVSAKDLVHIAPDMVDQFADVEGFADEDIDSRDSSDDSKFTYYSPKVNGFQVGLSWSPTTDSRGSVPTADRSNFEAGISYSGKVGGGKLEAAFSGSALPNEADDPDDHNYDWIAGFTYSHSGFTVGAGYKDEGDRDTTGYNVGVSYSGGRWEGTLYWVDTKDESGGAGADVDWQMLGLTGGYNLGGGLAASASVWFFDLEDEADSTENNEGTAVIFALGARF